RIVTRAGWTRPPSIETSSRSTRVFVATTLPIESTEPSLGYVKEPLRAAATSAPPEVRTWAVPRMSAAAAGAAMSAVAIAAVKARARISRQSRGMRAMVLDRPGQPLRAAELPGAQPAPGQLL